MRLHLVRLRSIAFIHIFGAGRSPATPLLDAAQSGFEMGFGVFPYDRKSKYDRKVAEFHNQKYIYALNITSAMAL